MTAAVTDLDDAALLESVVAANGKPFQARQIVHWLYRHQAQHWDDCRNVPKALRASLAEHTPLRSTEVVRSERSDDGTLKMLVRLSDNDTVETVLIPDGERNTLCISTQVGCPVACIFCASGMHGVRRNLSSGEIVEQVLHALSTLPEGRRLTNLVVMGMGEPLLNLPALLPALDRIRDPDGIGMGARRITVSTSGYPSQMRKLANHAGNFGLAVSLHAANDELRKELVPTATAPVAKIVSAARDFFATKGREVTFEMVLLAERNDRPQDAHELVRALSGFPCTVNLIPWNPVDEIQDLARPSDARVDGFAGILTRAGLNVTVRRQRGADRSAACGQLRIRELQDSGSDLKQS